MTIGIDVMEILSSYRCETTNVSFSGPPAILWHLNGLRNIHSPANEVRGKNGTVVDAKHTFGSHLPLPLVTNPYLQQEFYQQHYLRDEYQ